MKRNAFTFLVGVLFVAMINQLGCNGKHVKATARFPIGENVRLRDRVIDTTLVHLGRVKITVDDGQLDIQYLSTQPRTTLWQIYTQQKSDAVKQSGSLLRLQPKAYAQQDAAELPPPDCKTDCPDPRPGGPIRIKWVEFPLDGENGTVVLCAAIPCGDNE